MELADSYATLNEVPPEHLPLYIEKDGKAVLDLGNAKSKEDFDRYATALRARLADATGDLKAVKTQGLSRDEIKALITEVATTLTPKPPTGDNKANGAGDAALATRVHDLERELEQTKEKLSTASTEREKAQGVATTTTIKNGLTGAAVKTGVRPEAVDSLVQLVAQSFELSGAGGVVTKLEGALPTGVTPNSTPEDFFAAVKRAPEYSYFWPASKGSGAQRPGDGGNSGDAGNPWSAKGWNLTAQGAAIKADRANAETLAKSAGSFIGATKPPK